MRLSALVTVLALAFAAPGAAQEQRAAIEGTVSDASGAVVPGARVEARSAAGLTVRTETDATGRYRFPALPPGRFEVAAHMRGLAGARFAGIELLLGQVLQVDLLLSAASVQETVTVTAERPLIDLTQSARSTHLRDELITKLPRGRDFTSLVSQAAGANPEGYWQFGGLSIDGSSGSENRFVIDGVETTELLQGRSGMGLVTDFVEEVQVKSSGYAAEYGGATGGVINVITRSGTNQWTGEAGAYYFGEWLQGGSRPYLQPRPSDGSPEYLIFPKDSFDRWEPGFSVGGPVRKDRAWVFASYWPALLSTERTVTFRANNQTGTFTNAVRTHDASANLTAQLWNRIRSRVAFSMSPTVEDGALPFQNGNSPPDPSNYDFVTHRSRRALSATVDFVATPRFLLSARGAYWFANVWQEGIHQGPQYRFLRSNIGMPGVPTHLQGRQGTTNVFTNNEVTRDTLRRQSLQLDGTAFITAAGRHGLKAGVQLDRLGNDVLRGPTGNPVSLFWGASYHGQRGAFGYYQVLSNGVLPERGFLIEGDVRIHNLALYVQDAWSITDRLTLNVGLRTERERVPSFTSAYGIAPTAIEFKFGQKLAPRLGAAWDVRGDGRWKAYGSWGVFHDTMKYGLPRSAFGGVKFLSYWFTLDTADWPGLIRPGCPPACPGTLIEGPIDRARPVNTPEENAVDPGIDPFRLQEAVAGVEHGLTRTLSVGVRYVHKQVDKALETIGALDEQGNQVYVIGNPGFGRAAQTGLGPAFPKAVRDYDAVEVTLDKRMADRWALRASYLRSRLFGNYTGLAHEAEGTPMPNDGSVFDHPIMMFGQDGRPVLGPLASDRPHQFKAHGVYDFRFGTTVGVSARAMSGIPVTREVSFIPAFFSYPVFYRGRNSDGRLPALSQVDLYVEHEIAFGGRRRLQLSVNVINLFDQDAPVLRWPYELLDAVDMDHKAFLLGFDMEEIIATQELRRDPLFLSNYAFQLPREVRLGLKLTF